MSGEEEPVKKRGCSARALVIGFIGFILLLFVAPTLAGDTSREELFYHLTVGCVLHASRAFSHFATDLPQVMKAALLPGLATMVALWGAHRLILWWRLASGKNQGWHFKHTALAGSLVLLGSAGAIALSGIAHEAVWLPQGKIIRSNRSATRTMATNNARQLGMLMFEQEAEQGKFPQSLLDLQALAGDHMNLRRMMFVELDNEGPPEPFSLLKPGGTAAGNPSEVLMLGPQMPEEGDFVVLKLDYSVTRLPTAKFIEVVRSATGANPEVK